MSEGSGGDPHTITVPQEAKDVNITLFFHGHYAEPPHTIEYNVSSKSVVYNLSYSVGDRVWKASTS